MSRATLLTCYMVLLVCSYASGQTVYWSNAGNAESPDDDTIQRAAVNGAGVETLVSSGFDTPFGMAIDIQAGKIYFTDLRLPPNGKIMRANLDGSGFEELVTGLAGAAFLDLDIAGGKMYWTSFVNFPESDRIQRANLDGTGLEDLVTDLPTPLGFALDLSHGRMYWTENSTRKIRRANLNGSNVEDVIVEAPFAQPVDIAIDSVGGFMIWTDNSSSPGARIHRADLDGLNRTVLVDTGLNNPGGIILSLDEGKMYWNDTGTEKIQRANLDGTDVEDLVTTGLMNLSGIALDPRVIPVPTVSHWGLTVLTILLLTFGTVVVGRKRQDQEAT